MCDKKHNIDFLHLYQKKVKFDGISSFFIIGYFAEGHFEGNVEFSAWNH